MNFCRLFKILSLIIVAVVIGAAKDASANRIAVDLYSSFARLTAQLVAVEPAPPVSASLAPSAAKPGFLTPAPATHASLNSAPGKRVAARPGSPQTKPVKHASTKRTSTKRRSTKRASFVGFSKKSRRYNSLILRHATARGVPVKLAHAIVRVESNYNPRARGRAGEIGLMQIMPATARGIGYRGKLRNLYVPNTNLRWGMKYLGKAYKKAGGNVCKTILYYNAGLWAKRMNRVSARYCRRVKGILRRS